MTNGIIVDFDSQICAEVKKWLPHDINNTSIVSALNGMGSGELLIRLFNWMDRLVHPHPRRVFYAQELLANPLCRKHLADIGMIAIKLEKGADVGAHLSRSVKYGFSPSRNPKRKSLTRRQDLDMLLNDWGIHHLHLSDDMEPDGFVRRGSLLLFAIFTHTGAYLLDLLPHGEWTNQHMVEVAIRNWPDGELFLMLNGILGERDLSSDNRKVLRDKGISSMVSVDGKQYISRTTGISTAGTSNSATMRSIRLRSELDHIEKQLAANRDFLRPYIEERGRIYPDQPDFRITLFNGPSGFGFGLREEITGTVIALSY